MEGFIQNILGEKTEEEVMQEVLYISAPRYDLARSAPLPGQGDEEHAAWLGVWAKLGIEGLHGFPLWEGAVHDCLQPQFAELQSIFRAYACGTIAAGAAGASQMDMEEFNDFAVECALPTKECSRCRCRSL